MTEINERPASQEGVGSHAMWCGTLMWPLSSGIPHNTESLSQLDGAQASLNHECASVHTQEHRHRHAHTYTHAHVQTRTRTHIYTRTRTDTHAHTYTHTHVQTHMDTRPYGRNLGLESIFRTIPKKLACGHTFRSPMRGLHFGKDANFTNCSGLKRPPGADEGKERKLGSGSNPGKHP